MDTSQDRPSKTWLGGHTLNQAGSPKIQTKPVTSAKALGLNFCDFFLTQFEKGPFKGQIRELTLLGLMCSQTVRSEKPTVKAKFGADPQTLSTVGACRGPGKRPSQPNGPGSKRTTPENRLLDTSESHQRLAVSPRHTGGFLLNAESRFHEPRLRSFEPRVRWMRGFFVG